MAIKLEGGEGLSLNGPAIKRIYFLETTYKYDILMD